MKRAAFFAVVLFSFAAVAQAGLVSLEDILKTIFGEVKL